MRVKRIDEIEEYVEKQKNVSLDELCEHFHVSKSTIRRDIDLITSRGNVKKTYGGISSMPQKSDNSISFNRRSVLEPEAKRRIAKKAAEFVEDGDTIFIDTGTTTSHLVDFLAEKRDITVVTNNLDFILRAIPYDNIRIISFSGVLDRDVFCLTGFGGKSIEILESFNFKKAFLAATGVTLEYGVMNSVLTDTEFKVAVLRRTQKSYLLVDRTKFGEVTVQSYCTLRDIDYLVTDKKPPDSIISVFKENGKEIVLAD